MSVPRLPVRPDLDQLRRQAKELLREMRRRDPSAKLAAAQFALARRYNIASWPRLVLACRVTAAIWDDDRETLREIVRTHPHVLREPARGAPDSNWGPPMSYAANLGRDEIVAMLGELGAQDVQHAFERACLQGQLSTARELMAMGAKPMRGSVMGPCETLNAEGLAFLLDHGAELCDASGDPLAPVALVLQTYSRGPAMKHDCIAVLEAHGVRFPETAAMAVHRGDVDRLAALIRRDAGLLARPLAYGDIYPPEVGCSADTSYGVHGTPLAGATLLHMAVDYDELDVARWLLDHGCPADVRGATEDDGFGGHTALFGSVVSCTNLSGQRDGVVFAELLLAAGADPNARASLRKRLRYSVDDALHEYRNVTPVGWGRAFFDQDWVSDAAIERIASAGGAE